MEIKFTKSALNKGTENAGLALLLTDARFQQVDGATKKEILALIGASTSYGVQTFDAVMTPLGGPPITAENVAAHFDDLRLVEMKTTRKPIRNAGLSGFFFGATEREYAMAKALGDKYLFAFIVLNDDNDYRAPFAVLLNLSEVEERTQGKRVQYQVNFRINIDPGNTAAPMIVFGSESNIPRA